MPNKKKKFKAEKMVDKGMLFIQFDLFKGYQAMLVEFKDVAGYAGKNTQKCYFTDDYNGKKGWVADPACESQIIEWLKKGEWFDVVEWCGITLNIKLNTKTKKTDAKVESDPDFDPYKNFKDNFGFDDNAGGYTTGPSSSGGSTKAKSSSTSNKSDTGNAGGFYKEGGTQSGESSGKEKSSSKNNQSSWGSEDDFFNDAGFDDFVPLEVTPEMDFLSVILGNGAPVDLKLSIIKDAYRKAAKVYHPDKNPNNKAAADMMAELTVKYNQLKSILEGKKLT